MPKKRIDLAHLPLFAGIDPPLLAPLLDCLQAQEVTVPAHTTLLAQGDAPTRRGLLLSGTVQVIQQEADGTRHVQAELGPDVYKRQCWGSSR